MLTVNDISEEHVGTMLPQVPLEGETKVSDIDDGYQVIDTDEEMNNFIIEMMELDDYEDIMTESTMLTSEDIYYNRTKYENGDVNICFITGYSGGGKSTMSRGEKKMMREVVDMDRVILFTNKPDEYYKNMGKFVDSFMNKGPGRKYRESVGKNIEGKNISDNFRKSISRDMIKFAKSYAKEHKSSRLVLEGVWIYRYVEPNEADNCAVYIKGTSLATSTSRAIKRDNTESKEKNKGNGLTRAGYAVAKTFMASKDFLLRHLEKWQKYFGPKYEKQKKSHEQVSMLKQTKNTAKGMIHDSAGFIKKITESEIDIMNMELVCESFEDSVINKMITNTKINFKTRKLISKIYALKIKIADLEESEIDDDSNKKLIEMKRDYVNYKSELLKIKKSADKDLKKAIGELESKAKKEADEAIDEIKKKKSEKETVTEGVSIDTISDIYFTEMNHISGDIEYVRSLIKEKLNSSDSSLVKKDDVLENVENSSDKIKELESQFDASKKAFEDVYTKYKGTKIGEKTLGDYVTFEPICKEPGFVASYLKVKNSYMYIQSDCLIDYTCEKDDESNIIIFTSILHTIRKIVAETQKKNPNKLVLFKLFVNKDNKGKNIRLLMTIRTTIGKVSTKPEPVKESVDVVIEEARDRDNDGKLEVSPELKRLDEKRGRLAELKSNLAEAEKMFKSTSEKIYENKIKGLTAKIEKLEKELKEDDKKLAKEEKQQGSTSDKEDKSVTESTIDTMSSIFGTFEEAANMEDEIKPIVDKLNNKGYKVKYASPGHKHLRKKEDREPDGVYHGKLYSDARIMFADKYDFPNPPKYWHWREVDGCSYLDITPEGYDASGSDTPDEAFAKWKKEYMESLKSFVESLKSKDSKDEETKESVDEFSESVITDIYESMGLTDVDAVASYTTESTNKENNLLKELDELLS